MFKKLLIPALIAASISSVAVAQDRGQDRGRDDRNRGDNMQRGNDNNRGNDYRGNDRRDDRRYDNDRDHRGPGMQNRGAGPRHDLHKGGRLPSNYRNKQYIVNDWRGHRLSAPPRGYQWVQTGSDYVLVAAATGLIASILLSQ